MLRDIKMRCKQTVLLLLLGFILTTSFSVAGVNNDNSRKELNQASVKVAVTIVPQVEWIEEIGGEHVDVSPLIPAGQSPHTYNPTTDDLIFMSEADVWFSIGLTDFETANKGALIGASENPSFQYVNLSIGLDLLQEQVHNEGLVMNQVASNVDPHIWLSPTRTIHMLGTIRDKLQEIDPAHSAEYATNAASYISRLTDLNSTIAYRLSAVNKTVMLVFHPSWGYFADDFGLTLIALEEDGKDPSSAHFVKVIDEARANDVGAIFIQEEVSVSVADAFAREACVEIVQLYPLASDYYNNLDWTTDLLVVKLDQEPVCKGVPGFTISIALFVLITVAIPILIRRKKNG